MQNEKTYQSKLQGRVKEALEKAAKPTKHVVNSNTETSLENGQIPLQVARENSRVSPMNP